MRNRIYLYMMLILSVMIQVAMKRRFGWFPDVILLVLLFAAIFRGGVEAIAMGLAAGFLRSCFAVGTFPLDVFLFPCVVAVASILSGRVYRQAPAIQVFIVFISVLIVITTHTVYLNAVSANGISVFLVLTKSWGSILLTVIAAPPLFWLLKGVWHLDEWA